MAALAMPTATPHRYRRPPMVVIADESQAWVAELSHPATREAAATRLHALLLRAARFEVGRRRRSLGHVHMSDVDDLATQAADDALIAILAKLDTFEGRSRFTTWAYKFVLLEAAVKLRRRAWQGHEVTIDEESWTRMAANGHSANDDVETAELLGAIADAVPRCLTEHQRRVLTALALDGVPVDVLAERLDTTRGALYKTLHDARRRLRAELEEEGLLR
jgi:RNA polymerase sigma-70 factor, ECF subfamily